MKSMLEVPDNLAQVLAKADEMGRPEKRVEQHEIDSFEGSQQTVLPQSLKDFWKQFGERALGNRTIFAF